MSSGDAVLLVTVPFCSFRKGFAREFYETETFPPPSTVYGFLLSLVGEEDRERYAQSRIACAIFGQPSLSVVLRTVWRVKDKKKPPGTDVNRRPDFQELLGEVTLAVLVAAGDLAEQVTLAGSRPQDVQRFGGLSLGESRDLVNDINWFPRQWPADAALWLTNDPKGDLSLPVWVDHVGSKHTRWQRFNLTPGPLPPLEKDDPRWISIRPATAQ